MMKVFITGSESFVGRELTRLCDREKVEVSGCDSNEPKDARFHRMDIRSQNIAEIIDEEVDAVVHLAALSNNNQCDNNAYEAFDVNVMGTLNLINAAERRKAGQFIFASSEWVYDSFAAGQVKTEESLIDVSKVGTEYALSKLVSESNLRQQYEHGFRPVTILRFGIIYGVRRGGSAVESLFRSVMEKDEIKVGSLRTGRCFIHVSDIASGILKSVGLDGFNIINLQGDKLVRLGDVIEASKKILKRNPNVIETDAENASVKTVSNGRAAELLDWKPKVSLEEGLRLLTRI